MAKHKVATREEWQATRDEPGHGNDRRAPP